MVKIKKKTQSIAELQANTDAIRIKKKRKEIEYKFRLLRTVDDSMFQYSFLRAQAEEICDTLSAFSYGPFKGLYHRMKATVFEPSFMHDYYLINNEHGELEPDHERLSKHLPLKIILQE